MDKVDASRRRWYSSSIIIITRPKPAYGRQGLPGVLHCAPGAQLRRIGSDQYILGQSLVSFPTHLLLKVGRYYEGPESAQFNFGAVFLAENAL